MAVYIAYYRVSTARQQRSGLGLEAQKAKVKSFLRGSDHLMAEFVEAQSGRKDNRTELSRALKLAKEKNAYILIARLDRFSRRVSFIAGIMDQGIKLVVAEMPHATDFQLHIFAALAQEERRLISARTKAALSEAKKRGRELGRNGRILADRNRSAADEFAHSIRRVVRNEMQLLGYSEIARRLNVAGIRSRSGGMFYPQTVKNYLTRPIRNGATKDDVENGNIQMGLSYIRRQRN